MEQIEASDNYVEAPKLPEDIYQEGYEEGFRAGLEAINEMPIQELLDVVSMRIKQSKAVV